MIDKINIPKIQKQKPIQELLEFSIINLDKPPGPTSFKIGQKIKNLLGLRKTSHFGTLDPKVTGVLPVALNRACKLLDFFIHRDKVYAGEMYIHSEISKEKLENEMKKFLGVIKQLPPVKSRVKRQERERNVNKFKILEFNKEKRNVKFLVDVEAGTYIRKLVHDLGENIGGAHMTKLRRIKAGLFEEKDIVGLNQVETAVKLWKKENNENKLREILIPAEIISELYPVIQVKKQSVKKLLTGKPLMKSDLKSSLDDLNKLKNQDIFVVFNNNRFIETARKTNEGDIIARPMFVMQALRQDL